MSRPFCLRFRVQTYEVDGDAVDVTCIFGAGCGAGGFVAGAGPFGLFFGTTLVVLELGVPFQVSRLGFKENRTPRFAFSLTVRCKST